MAGSKEEDAAEEVRKSNQAGRDSLCGYLYQVLGTAAFRAMARHVNETDQEVDAHLRLIRKGTVKPESLGQDAEFLGDLDGKRTRILAQFKYSRVDPPTPIAEQELLEIAKKLHDSAVLAADIAEETGYLLVSNRPLTADATAMVEAARTKTKHPQLRWRKDQTSVLAVMAFKQIDRSGWVAELDAYASRLGVPKREAEGRRFDLVGRLMTQTAGPGDIEVDDGLLREVFAGHREARSLSWDELEPVIRDGLRKFQDDANFDLRLIRRGVIEEIAKWAGQRCLILVSGEGGRGKSTALYQVLLARLLPFWSRRDERR